MTNFNMENPTFFIIVAIIFLIISSMGHVIGSMANFMGKLLLDKINKRKNNHGSGHGNPGHCADHNKLVGDVGYIRGKVDTIYDLLNKKDGKT